MQPDAFVAALDAEGVFFEDAEAHVLQHRQAVRQRHRAAEPEQLEAHRGIRVLQPAVELQPQGRGLGQLLHLLDVGDRGHRVEAVAIAGSEPIAIAPMQAIALVLADPIDQSFAQHVAPASRRADDPLLDLGDVVVGRPAGPQGDDEMDPRQGLVAEGRGIGGDPAVPLLGQDLAHPDPELGGVALARDVDQAGQEAAEAVGPQEQPGARPGRQMQHTHGVAVELLVGALEQLVARIGLQHVGQGLAVMAGRGEAGPGDDPLDLLAQQRDRPRVAVVGGGGEMADEGVLADHPALGVVALDPDQVEMGRPVHRRAAIRLEDQQG